MDLNIKAIKLLEENIRENLQHLGLGKELPKPQNIKEKDDKLDSLKLKAFLFPKTRLTA